MPNMNWDKVRREELLKHDDVTLRTGRRQGIAESGPSSDGTLTRAERRQARLELLYGLDDCASGPCAVRLIVREGQAFLAFDSQRHNREIPTTIVGNLAPSAIDISVHCASPTEIAKALRYQYSPKYWWPLRLELQESSVDERMVLRASLRVEQPDTPAVRLPIGELSEDSATRSSQPKEIDENSRRERASGWTERMKTDPLFRRHKLAHWQWMIDDANARGWPPPENAVGGIRYYGAIHERWRQESQAADPNRFAEEEATIEAQVEEARRRPITCFW